ncbi:MAG: hypothetical protein GTO60_11200, partial [Gammaproteobacteria bacterium]|nr:hypothetical protein [Gammaproteobacteria bacterium]
MHELKDVGLSNEFHLFGRLLANADQLHQFAGAKPLNTDDNTVVMFKAP